MTSLASWWSARSGLDGVVLFSFRGSLALILVALAASFILAGLFYPYWRIADMDFMMVYQGFLLGDRRPQNFFDHPGHLNVLMTDAWFRLLRSLGILQATALSQIPPAEDVAGFERVWTAAVRAGRVLSLAIAAAFILAFGLLLRALLRDDRLAALGTFLVAFSGGVMMHARVMRTDLVAAGLVTLALLLVLIAARRPASAWRPLLIGCAALLATLGIVNKVQALFLVAALPVIALLFGTASEAPARFWRQGHLRAVALAGALLLAFVVVPPALEMIRFALTHTAQSVFPFRPFAFGAYGVYQAVLALYVAAAVVLYAAIFRVPAVEALATLLAIACGVALGLFVMLIHFQPQNLLSVVNPIEHMFAWATRSDPQLRQGEGIVSGHLLRQLGAGILDELKRKTFVLHSSPRPTIFLEWAVIAGLVFAWRRGERRLVLQTASLLAVAFLIDVVGTLRGLKLEYFVFGDPLVVIAAAWLASGLPALRAHRLAFPIAAVLVAAHVVVSQAEPVKHTLLRRGPEGTCHWHQRYMPEIPRFPFCPDRS